MKKVIWTVGLSSVLMASPLALAGERVDESRPASSKSFIHIEHINGKCEIRGWDKDEVTVEGELGDRTEEFTFKEDDGDIHIEVEVKSQRGNWGSWDSDDGDDLVIHVPFGSTVSYETINADVSLMELTGKTDIEVVNGEIDIKNLSGKVNIESVNGNVDIDKVDGALNVETVNGNIEGAHTSDNDLTIESVNGNIEFTSETEEVVAETVNGDIELKLGTIREGEFNSVNGDIEVEMELEDGGDVQGSTVGGDIKLMFQPDVSARFEIEAHAGGRITNGLTKDKMQKAKYGPRRWLNFSTGSGSAEVDLSTVSGRISVDGK